MGTLLNVTRFTCRVCGKWYRIGVNKRKGIIVKHDESQQNCLWCQQSIIYNAPREFEGIGIWLENLISRK